MKKINFFFKVLFISLIGIIYHSAYAVENRIVANINDKIISSYELENKIKTLIFLSNQQLTQENINSTKSIAITALINHKLKKKELEIFNVPLESPEEINNHLMEVSLKYNSNVDNFKNTFNNLTLDYDLYLDEIKIQFAWQKLVYKKYNNKLNIDENEINKELNIFLKNNKDIENFKLSEIEILANNSEDTKKKIEEIKNQIKLVGFENTAIKFSISPSSSDGGVIGWVNSKSLSNQFLNIVKNMKPGEISEPIYQSSSIVFLKLVDKKLEGINDLNIKKIKDQIINSKINELVNIYSNNYLSKLKNNAFIELK
jgi:peptidyl-prolyl cis-trans isomerase SurA